MNANVLETAGRFVHAGDRRQGDPHAQIAPRIAVLLPCFNEAPSVEETIEGFRRALPDAEIFVCDNNSSDGTAEVARRAGATILRESRPGKGWAIRRLFADVDADLYVMADGDATYTPEDAREMIRVLVEDGCDMVVGHRLNCTEGGTFRRGHVLGNRLFAGLAKTIFGGDVGDLLSGYRVLSRRFVKTFPAESRGFEIETELTVFACEHRMSFAEVDTAYLPRGEGSVSKLSTYRDGSKIAWMLLRLFRDTHPLRFFGGLALGLGLVSIILFIPIFETYLERGEVPRLPTLVAIGIMDLAAMLLVTIGVILQRTASIRRYLQFLHYLSYPAPNFAPLHGSNDDRLSE